MKDIKERIKTICKKHNLGEMISFEDVNEGVLNENYIFETSAGKFFLKNCRNTSAIRMHYIQKVENFMRISSIPVITTIAIDVDRRYMLYPFIESDRSHNYTQNDYYLIGKMLGSIHAVTFGNILPKNLQLFRHTDKKMAKSLKKIKHYAEFLKNKEIKNKTDLLFIKYIKKKLNCADNFLQIKMLPSDTLIHGDYHAGNLLINKSPREIIGICDWEKSEYAPRAYDIARAYLHIGFGTNVDDVASCREIGEEVLRGYRNVLPISEEEFQDGIRMRLKSYIFTCALEDKYYLRHDARANKFVKKSINILNYFYKKK